MTNSAQELPSHPNSIGGSNLQSEPQVANGVHPGASNESVLEIAGVSKRYGDRDIVKKVSLSVHAGEFFCLLGPSGCGKTTLLRMIAGLEESDQGSISILGRELAEYPAKHRPLHLVFQSYALFPHLSVFENIAFGLRMKGTPEPERRVRVNEMLALVQLEHARDRTPDRLSGGERQRVALARALVNRPKLLLLDEPLAAIDRKLRAALQTELKEIQRRTGIAFVCVTHDQDEAMILGDRIGLMYRGELVQVGTPHELYQTPKTLFTARFVGDCTAFQGKIAASPEHPNLALLQTEIGQLLVSRTPSITLALESSRGSELGSQESAVVTVVVRPERVDAVTRSHAPQNKLSGIIESVSYLGSRVRLVVRLSPAKTILAEFPSDARMVETARVGKSINILINPDALVAVINDVDAQSAADVHGGESA